MTKCAILEGMDTNFFKQKLEAERERLLTELKKVGRKNPDDPEDWIPALPELEPEPDPVDEADRVEEYEERTAVEQTLESRYRDVLRALEKIEKGTFGLCNAGGAPHPIEEGRLKANPAARNCMKHMGQYGK